MKISKMCLPYIPTTRPGYLNYIELAAVVYFLFKYYGQQQNIQPQVYAQQLWQQLDPYRSGYVAQQPFYNLLQQSSIFAPLLVSQPPPAKLLYEEILPLMPSYNISSYGSYYYPSYYKKCKKYKPLTNYYYSKQKLIYEDVIPLSIYQQPITTYQQSLLNYQQPISTSQQIVNQPYYPQISYPYYSYSNYTYPYYSYLQNNPYNYPYYTYCACNKKKCKIRPHYHPCIYQPSQIQQQQAQTANEITKTTSKAAKKLAKSISRISQDQSKASTVCTNITPVPSCCCSCAKQSIQPLVSHAQSLRCSNLICQDC